jgi:hypothetical protein
MKTSLVSSRRYKLQFLSFRFFRNKRSKRFFSGNQRENATTCLACKKEAKDWFDQDMSWFDVNMQVSVVFLVIYDSYRFSKAPTTTVGVRKSSFYLTDRTHGFYY